MTVANVLKRAVPSGTALLAVLLAYLILLPAASPAQETSRKVTSVGVSEDSGGTTVTIGGDGPLDYEYFLIEGKSLVIDILDAVNEAWPTVREVQNPYLTKIKIGEHFQPKVMVRVLLELRQSVDFQVRGEGSRIIVQIGEKKKARKKAPAPSHLTVEDMIFEPMAERSRITLPTSAKPVFSIVDSKNPRQVIVDISKARIDPRALTALDLSELERELGRITLIEDRRDDGFAVRLIAHLEEEAPFQVRAEDSALVVDIDHRAGGAPAEKADSPAAVAAQIPREGTSMISLDFIDADVTTILNTLSEMSGINFAFGSEVKGKISLNLVEVTFDEALDTILMINNPRLVQTPAAGNIIRITTEEFLDRQQERLQRQQEMESRRLEADKKMAQKEKELETLVYREFPISYAQLDGANGLLAIVKSLTSDRVEKDGYFAADPRTNTIIVSDLQQNINDIERAVKLLDSPTPAVVIEARIVEMNSSDARELGVQWGMGFTADQAHGNALPYEFPNSVNLQGTQGTAEGSQTPFMVNLPIAASTSGIGISLGHIANTFSLDLRLQAMEAMSKVKILSTPHVLVVQNETARINVGQELPIPATDAEGNRTVTWREVGISLEVTPQITNDARVFMEIKVAKESPGETVNTTEGAMFSINSKKAETQVLIRDGETAVIGGLSEEQSREARESTPLLSEIPLLGWLFKQKSNSLARQEMMIFLTPRIVPAR